MIRIDDTKVEEIEEIEKREFGFMYEKENKPIMVRYVSFLTQRELEDYIAMRKPKDCYVSVAYYSGAIRSDSWLGAELFFDIDCKENLRLARADAETVYEVLLDDFALKDVSLRRSGSKGYHVLSRDEEPRSLVAISRREICDYMREKYNVETIDAPASGDIRRLRRIAGTINSKSGEYCNVIKASM